MSSKLKVAILIVSTTAAKDPSTDASADILKNVLEQEGGGNWDLAETSIVPDDLDKIQDALKIWTTKGINLILTTGGTGFATSDSTPEVCSSRRYGHTTLWKHEN
jgi:gephyrin